MNKHPLKYSEKTTLIKRCHVCGQITESHQEIDRCPTCKKSFLPLNYFEKIHDVRTKDDYRQLFEVSDNLVEEDLVKGVYVLW